MLKKLSFILLCSFLLSACNDGNNYANPQESVTDNSTPVLNIPNDLIIEATGSETSVSLDTVLANDLVDGSVTVTHDAPTLFPIGTTIVTYTATDTAGNVSTATQQVTVLDTTPPTITPPEDVTIESTGTTTTVLPGEVSATDLVDGVVAVASNAPATFPIGTTLVTYTASDSANNVATAIQQVTVIDITAPTITLPADITIEATGVTTTVLPGNAIAIDREDGVVPVNSNAPATFPVGTTFIIYTATDSEGSVSTATQRVTVLDTTAPTITTPSDITINTIGPATTVSLGNVSALDVVDGFVAVVNTAPVMFFAGTTLVTYSATDTAGNIATAIQQVTVIDITAPTITLPADITIEATGITTTVLTGSASATDVNGDTVPVTHNAPATFPLGTTLIIYTATDAAGNVATATQQVTVLDTIAPTLTAPADITIEATGATTAVLPETAVATDIVDGSVVVTSDAPVAFPVGTTIVTYSATDTAGNVATATQQVTVLDTIAPTLTAPADITIEASGATTAVLPGTAVATDIVDGSVVATSDAPVVFPVGTTIVTYSATDTAGNVATATQQVTVLDTIAPTLTAPADITIEATGATTAVLPGTAVAMDIVDGSVVVTSDAPVAFPVGTTLVTYSATDTVGNVATATQQVTILDTTAPTMTSPADITTEATGATTAVLPGTAVATDIVDGSVVVTSDAPVAFPVGNTIVTYSATDTAGNVATATQQVTVIDSTAPVIAVPSDVNLDSNDGNPVSGFIGLATANDLVDGNVIVSHDAPALFPVGTTTVTYTASDSVGNVASAIQTVTVTIVYIAPPTIATTPTLTLVETKGFQFDWPNVAETTFYRLLENPDGLSGFTQLGADIPFGNQTVTETVALYQRVNAQYILQSCNPVGCTDSAPLSVTGHLNSAIGTVTADNSGNGDRFGSAVSLSADSHTLAIGAPREDSITTGINGSGNNNSALQSGAVYIFIRNGVNWTQQAYIKASNTETGDAFGTAVSLSSNGNTLAVGAYLEDSNATGINNNQLDNSATDSGAAYVFTRTANSWSQQAYIKASNTDADDYFGEKISLSGDGITLAVGALRESSHATGVNGNESDNSLTQSGATYIYKLVAGNWIQEAYIKASNSGLEDRFGSVSLSEDGNTLAVAAYREKSTVSGINGDQNNDDRRFSGAAYIFTRAGSSWIQHSYIKASNPDTFDYFGFNISLSGDGNTLAVGAYNNDSSDTGMNGNETDNDASNSGAVYVFMHSGSNWTQEAFIKASNTGTSDLFGWSLTLSHDGNTLAIGAYSEESNATGINGSETDNSTSNAGAVYVFNRNAGSWTQQAYVKSVTSGSGYLGYSTSLSGDGNTLATGAERHSSAGAVLLY